MCTIALITVIYGHKATDDTHAEASSLSFKRIEIVHHTMTDLQVLAAWFVRSFSRKVASSMRDCVEQ